jgi:hypothetical protein
MFKALVCYVVNASPEITRICKTLDKVVRHMVRNRPLNEIEFHVDSVLPDIQRYIESRDDLVPLSIFTPVDLSIHEADHLELFSRAKSPKKARQIQYAHPNSIELDEGAQGLAYKRRRLSL